MLELVASPQQQAFGLDKRDTLPRYCRECDVRFACNGGCPKDRFIATPDGEPGLNYLCAGYKDVLPPRRPADADHGTGSSPEPRAVRDRRSSTPLRTPSAAATTRAPAATAASGSTATAPTPVAF